MLCFHRRSIIFQSTHFGLIIILILYLLAYTSQQSDYSCHYNHILSPKSVMIFKYSCCITIIHEDGF